MTRNQRITLAIAAIVVGILFAVGSPVALQMIFERVMTPARNAEGELVRVLYPGANLPINIFASGLLGVIVGGFLMRSLQKLGQFWAQKWEEMHTGDKINLFLSIFAGLFASTPVLLFLNSMQATVYLPFAFIGLTVGLSAVSYFILRAMGDALPWSRGRGPAKRSGIKILDTNVLIDGRIYDVLRTGFMEGPVYIPRFVLEELQHIADSHDGLRRQRGRRGLDILRLLQAEFQTEVGNHDHHAADPKEEVDSRLVRLARAIGADIVTNDWNLNRVAGLQNVKVLNLNDLSLALRPNVLPSEKLTITIIREGNQVGQGVGYLEDGTMVVVENGKPHLGETRDVTVSQVIQTERGKMIFAEVGEADEELSPIDSKTRRQSRRPY